MLPHDKETMARHRPSSGPTRRGHESVGTTTAAPKQARQCCGEAVVIDNVPRQRHIMSMVCRAMPRKEHWPRIGCHARGAAWQLGCGVPPHCLAVGERAPKGPTIVEKFRNFSGSWSGHLVPGNEQEVGG